MNPKIWLIVGLCIGVPAKIIEEFRGLFTESPYISIYSVVENDRMALGVKVAISVALICLGISALCWARDRL